MIKICGKIISHFMHSVIIFSGAIFITSNTDIGRRGICRITSTILSRYCGNIVSIRGWNGLDLVENFTYKTRDGLCVSLHGLKFKYKEKFNINIDKISLKSSKVDSDLRKTLDNIALAINAFRIYINNCNISTIEYNSGEFILYDVSVIDMINSLSFLVKIEDGKLDAKLSLINDKIDSVNIQIDKIYNANGKIIVSDCLQSETKLFADLSYLDNKITINGTSKNFTKGIICQAKCKLKNNSSINFDGNFFLNDKKITGQWLVNSKYLDTVFCQNDKPASLHINGGFLLNGSVNANFFINDETNNILSGKIEGDKKYTVSGNFFKLLPYNVKLKNFLFCLDSETKTANCQLNGNSWSAAANVKLNSNISEVNNLSFCHKDCDLSMVEPIVIKDKNVTSGRISFDCRDVKFLSDVFEYQWLQGVSGAFTGDLRASDGYKILDIFTDKISIKNIDIYGASFRQKDGNFWINLNGFEFQNSMFNDVDFSYIDGKILAKCDIDTDGKFLLEGETKDGKIFTFSKLKFLIKNVDFLAKQINITYHSPDVLSCLCDNIVLNNGQAKIDYFFDKNKSTFKAFLSKIPCKLFSVFNKSINGKIIDGLYMSGNFDLSENEQKGAHGKIQTKIEDKNDEIFSLNGQLDDSGFNLKANYSRADSKIDISGCIPVRYSLHDKTTKKLSKDLSVKCNTSIDLKNVFAVSDDFSLAGKLNSDLQIKGTLSKPLLNGNVKFIKGAIETSAVSVKNIELELIAKNNNIDIKQCVANDKNGTMKVAGKAKLDISQDSPKLILDSDVTFSNFELVNSEALKLTFDGKIKASGPIEKILLSGPLTLTKGIYDSSFAGKNLHSDIRIIRAGKRPKQLMIESKKLNLPFIFDIDATCKTLKVIGDSIESKFSGPMKVVSYNDELSMDGEFDLNSGYIKMLGIRVPIRSGKILFKKDKPLSPEVSLLGNTFVRDMQLFIDVNNKNDDKLAINIYSKPSYSIDNILSKIIFNKPSQELRIEESTKIHEAIKNLTHQESAFSLFDTLKDLMFFDTVSISNNNENSTNKDSHTISAGKYLSNNIYVGVDKTSEKEAKYKVRVNLSPQVTVEANSVGEAGISWIYRY